MSSLLGAFDSNNLSINRILRVRLTCLDFKTIGNGSAVVAVEIRPPRARTKIGPLDYDGFFASEWLSLY